MACKELEQQLLRSGSGSHSITCIVGGGHVTVLSLKSTCCPEAFTPLSSPQCLSGLKALTVCADSTSSVSWVSLLWLLSLGWYVPRWVLVLAFRSVCCFWEVNGGSGCRWGNGHVKLGNQMYTLYLVKWIGIFLYLFPNSYECLLFFYAFLLVVFGLIQNPYFCGTVPHRNIVKFIWNTETHPPDTTSYFFQFPPLLYYLTYE